MTTNNQADNQSLIPGSKVWESETCFIRFDSISASGDLFYHLVQTNTKRVRESGSLEQCLKMTKFW